MLGCRGARRQRLATHGPHWGHCPARASSASLPSLPCRLCYAAAVWCEVFIIAAGCVVVPHLGLGGGEGAPARSLIEWMLLAGHTWQLFTIACTPLPFRRAQRRGRAPVLARAGACSSQQVESRGQREASRPHHHSPCRALPRRVLFPVLAAQSAALMVRAPHMCASPGLQHAYATLHRSLLRTARHIHLLPPVAGAAALAPQSAAQLCATVYQPAGVILGNACSGYLAFSAELSERRAFVRRHNGAGQRRLLSLLHTYGRLPVEPASYWLQFGLPSACALLALQLSMRA